MHKLRCIFCIWRNYTRSTVWVLFYFLQSKGWSGRPEAASSDPLPNLLQLIGFYLFNHMASCSHPWGSNTWLFGRSKENCDVILHSDFQGHSFLSSTSRQAFSLLLPPAPFSRVNKGKSFLLCSALEAAASVPLSFASCYKMQINPIPAAHHESTQLREASHPEKLGIQVKILLLILV